MLCLTNTGFVQCFLFGSRSLLDAFVVSNLCFACFTSQTPGLCSVIPSAPVVCCTLLLLVTHALCSLPHRHRVCAVLFPSAPPEFTPFCFSLFYGVCFCYECFAHPAPVCAVIFSRAPSNLQAYFLLCIILCSAFFPSLTWIWSICLVCFISHCLQWCYFLGPCRFWMIMFSFAFFCNLARVFCLEASSSAGLLPCPSVFVPLFS